ncbi:hypothetical protein NDU88_002895 [Pleurodeles waltl]|uniref:Uncharacterized protein n=1 Tax=Pleurodeles waltl TaxID=8319 RepID=A0AAV7PBB6_PLEWA|nr:hypothetical protein NDU88_002895 [Pleurodeles waltl]
MQLHLVLKTLMLGPTLQEILQAITAFREAPEIKINTLGTDLGLLHDDHRRFADPVTSTENELADVASALTTTKARLSTTELRLKTLEAKVNDAENRSHQNNICLIGLPEHLQGNYMVTFLESWLRTERAPVWPSAFFALERAHWVPMRPLPPGAPPGAPLRLVVTRLLY